MKNKILKTDNLTKQYNGVYAIKNVSVTLEQGKIYGLIGRNGAGKSTFMRLLSGLTFADEGTIELFGHKGEKELQIERKRIGTMIEYPGVIPDMSAAENLRYHRMLRGIPNKEIEDELLELVGLNDTGKKKSKNFSLGMKQRLGIAISLLSNPELLILDEPVNGLDPIGVVEIRKLIKGLCENKQITILISSHNLPELYQTATDYIIIDKGEVKKVLTLEELDEKCRHHLLMTCPTPEKLVCVLEDKLNTKNFKVMPDKSIKLYDFLDQKELVSKIMSENEIVLTSFSNQGDTLEEFFISLVGRE